MGLVDLHQLRGPGLHLLVPCGLELSGNTPPAIFFKDRGDLHDEPRGVKRVWGLASLIVFIFDPTEVASVGGWRSTQLVPIKAPASQQIPKKVAG